MRFYGQAKGRRWSTDQPIPTLEQLGMKKCGSCGQVQPLDEFYQMQDRHGRKRHRSVCKTCDKARARERKKNARDNHNDNTID